MNATKTNGLDLTVGQIEARLERLEKYYRTTKKQLNALLRLRRAEIEFNTQPSLLDSLDSEDQD